jgi:hypothetical protein
MHGNVSTAPLALPKRDEWPLLSFLMLERGSHMMIGLTLSFLMHPSPFSLAPKYPRLRACEVIDYAWKRVYCPTGVA